MIRQEERKEILELGSGRGHDTLFLLQNGFEVCALDYSAPGLEAVQRKAEQAGLGRALKTARHDVRPPRPFTADTFDGCFSHVLYCMALTAAELETLSAEIRRLLQPGGLDLYTARNTQDSDCAAGIDRGEDLRELEGGFIVHFSSRDKVERLAAGHKLAGVEAFEEGGLPKRLWRVTQRTEK